LTEEEEEKRFLEEKEEEGRGNIGAFLEIKWVGYQVL
jgi:hypothetical protein